MMLRKPRSVSAVSVILIKGVNGHGKSVRRRRESNESTCTLPSISPESLQPMSSGTSKCKSPAEPAAPPPENATPEEQARYPLGMGILRPAPVIMRMPGFVVVDGGKWKRVEKHGEIVDVHKDKATTAPTSPTEISLRRGKGSLSVSTDDEQATGTEKEDKEVQIQTQVIPTIDSEKLMRWELERSVERDSKGSWMWTRNRQREH
ncbi:hypothetical protein BDZ91DRAFT_793025 [Kalaharituber pfeilii]|nr:hypothetical protein BDZ91DRAFT_793025 [Kalaharituber pfeilii]